MIDYQFGVTLNTLNRLDIDVLRRWRNSNKVRDWCRQVGLISEMDQERWYTRQNEDPTVRMFGVYKDHMVGVCGLTGIDHINQRAEFSLYIAPQSQGCGLSKPALKTLFSFGFYEMNLNLIWGETFDGNRAYKIFEDIGMRKEGTRRDFYFKHGAFLDAHLYSLKRDEVPW